MEPSLIVTRQASTAEIFSDRQTNQAKQDAAVDLTALPPADGKEKIAEQSDSALQRWAERAGVTYSQPQNHYARVQLANDIAGRLSSEEREQFLAEMQTIGAPAGLNYGLRDANGDALNADVRLDDKGQQVQALFAAEFSQNRPKNVVPTSSTPARDEAATDRGASPQTRDQPTNQVKPVVPLPVPAPIAYVPMVAPDGMGVGETGIPATGAMNA